MLKMEKSPVLPVFEGGEDPPWHCEPEKNIYLVPLGFVFGESAALVLQAGRCARFGNAVFTACEVLIRMADDRLLSVYATVSEIKAWGQAEGGAVLSHVMNTLERLSSKRPDFAGLSMLTPEIMGIVNVTPDSFSDGGAHVTPEEAVAHGLSLMEAGANILDIGGESTRPGAQPVSPEEEQKRILPVIEGLAAKGACISVDTRHASTMEAAVAKGAKIVNDVTALRGDKDSLRTVARLGVPVILMHMQKMPQNMQEAPDYAYAPLDIYDDLLDRIRVCREAGIYSDRICVDPGIGFGKTVDQNIQILSRLSLFSGTGCPVLLGVSRKSYIGHIAGEDDPVKRLPGSLAGALAGLDQGVRIVRVHDVAETIQAMKLWHAERAIS